jgi:hypothetical protein
MPPLKTDLFREKGSCRLASSISPTFLGATDERPLIANFEKPPFKEFGFPGFQGVQSRPVKTAGAAWPSICGSQTQKR